MKAIVKLNVYNAHARSDKSMKMFRSWWAFLFVDTLIKVWFSESVGSLNFSLCTRLGLLQAKNSHNNNFQYSLHKVWSSLSQPMRTCMNTGVKTRGLHREKYRPENTCLVRLATVIPLQNLLNIYKFHKGNKSRRLLVRSNCYRLPRLLHLQTFKNQ